jgi:tetratricopeptide (TPR) repeat protein
MTIGFRSSPRLPSILPIVWIAISFAHASLVFGQASTCPKVSDHDKTPADAAYSEGSYRKAEDLYGQALAQNPHDVPLSSALIRTWLHEGEISQASAQVNRILADNPRSAVALTDLAEVQLRQGQPWLTLETLNTATTSDSCYARIHLIRSRVFRIDSMYSSEREEIQRAYDIDPNDPDIKHAWLSIVSPARDIEGIHESLATTKDLDPEIRQKAEESIRSMLPLLSENNLTCKVVPDAVSSATFQLQASYQDAKHIDGYRLEVQLPQTKAKLQVDTAASGLYISRALADQNGLQPGVGAPPGTVHLDSVRIGPLEFRDCTVGVSEMPFAGKADGFIGTDMFASWLITLDHPSARLRLDPLPGVEGILPGNRPSDVTGPPELRGFKPVYHRQQYLLVPVLLNNKSRRLFLLDSGIRLSTMTSEVAHSVSSTRLNFTNSQQTVSGSTIQIYRDSFDFQFANLSVNHHDHVLELDPSTIEQSAGMQIAGMLGFDILHSFKMHLDYRDGLAMFESIDAEPSPGHANETMITSVPPVAPDESGKELCPSGDDMARPLNSTLEARVTGLLDSGHLKPGKSVTVSVVNEWLDPECRLLAGTILYGHVTASSSSKNPDASELALAFDHGDCDGHDKKELALRVIGVVAAPDQFVGLHNALPAEVAGGGRDISVTAQSMGAFALDENLNPGGPPHTIRPGIVAGIPKMKLEPLGGPGCSAKMTSLEHSVRLGPGTELILTRQSLH